jgi:hypothetical protein
MKKLNNNFFIVHLNIKPEEKEKTKHQSNIKIFI